MKLNSIIPIPESENIPDKPVKKVKDKTFISRYANLLPIGILFFSSTILESCQERTPSNTGETPAQIKKELTFVAKKIADSARFWWAHTPAEINGDGITDLVFINNNARGGYLAYYAGQQEEGLWKLNMIAEKPPTGGLFAAGDLECADIDGDGDTDVLAIRHPGEWADADAPAELFWYENPGWNSHRIGIVPDAVKDVSFVDFDRDGKIDLSVLTFEEHTLSVFKQIDAGNWERVQFVDDNPALHEGMDTGDLDGDGYKDIVANGFAFYNPGNNVRDEWKVENIDTIWNNQEGDWSRNGTKTFLRDLDNDGKDEVFISHSERAGYPLKLYRNVNGSWQSQIIADSIAACHTLQVYDFDDDGHYDVLAGVNRARAVNLNKDRFEIFIFLGENDYQNWQPVIIGTEGIYNGQVADYDNDGDYDIFRYPDHESKDFYLLENRLVSSAE